MSEAGPSKAPEFSARTMLALVAVGVVALAALAVLSAYAPDLRGGQDGQAHALSKSAIGYAGAPILMRALGEQAVVSRTRPHSLSNAALVLTPGGGEDAKAMAAFEDAGAILIVLPKWSAMADPVRPGFVVKGGILRFKDDAPPTSVDYAKDARLASRKGVSRPVLQGVGGPFAGRTFRLGTVDQLRTVSGPGWMPLITDESGNVVLAALRTSPKLWLLSDPDLLNNQGLGSRDTARAGAAILSALSQAGERALIFDVTLNGFERGRGLGRLMLEPPWLAATLIAVAAGLLMGFHALARFGQPRRPDRAIALGARALVDNSADLIRMARKEHELAPAYAALSRALVGKAAGGHTQADWLEELARRRGATAPDELAAEADKAKSRDDLLTVARKLYDWRGEMTRERR